MKLLSRVRRKAPLKRRFDHIWSYDLTRSAPRSDTIQCIKQAEPSRWTRKCSCSRQGEVRLNFAFIRKVLNCEKNHTAPDTSRCRRWADPRADVGDSCYMPCAD